MLAVYELSHGELSLSLSSFQQQRSVDHADADMYRELYQRNQSLQKQLLEAKEVRRGLFLIFNGSILNVRSITTSLLVSVYKTTF